MTKAQTKIINTLYKQLMQLCGESETFFFVDQVTVMGTLVRIFNYRMASYTDWLKPGALECRGIMFEMDGDTPVSIISRPMEKFFNYAEVKAWEALNESPIELGEVLDVMIKEDGSLISTFLDGGFLAVKSKGSVKSEQAMDAHSVLMANRELLTRLTEIAKENYTVNMEYVSPKNRIVVGYDSPDLRILNVRHNITGEYIPYDELFADALLRAYLVKRENIEVLDLDAFAKEAYQNEGFEGYVVLTTKGFVKIKTNWYVNLHRTKDSITNNKDLFLNIVENTVDDLKQLFSSDLVSLKKIDDFEKLFLDSLNRLSAKAFKAIEDNKGKSRKDFAISLSADLSNDGRIIFGPLMKYFEETDPQKLVDRIIEMMVKNYDQFIPEQYK